MSIKFYNLSIVIKVIPIKMTHYPDFFQFWHNLYSYTGHLKKAIKRWPCLFSRCNALYSKCFFTKFCEKRSKLDQPKNGPCHGFRRHLDGQAKRSEITVFVWESDSKCLLPKLKFPQFLNRNFKILGRRLYSPSLKDVAWLEDAQLFF